MRVAVVGAGAIGGWLAAPHGTGRTVEHDAILGTLLEAAAAVAMSAPTLPTILSLARMRARQAGLPNA